MQIISEVGEVGGDDTERVEIGSTLGLWFFFFFAHVFPFALLAISRVSYYKLGISFPRKQIKNCANLARN